jgi:hypothetical protein
MRLSDIMNASKAEMDNAMSYEIFSRKVTHSGTPAIALTKMGRLQLNKAASAILDKQATEHILLLWDAMLAAV